MNLWGIDCDVILQSGSENGTQGSFAPSRTLTYKHLRIACGLGKDKWQQEEAALQTPWPLCTQALPTRCVEKPGRRLNDLVNVLVEFN